MPQTLSTDAVVTDRTAYAEQAPELRERIRRLRALRRVRLGDMIALEFENADTLQFQVQEMVYVEGLSSTADVAHEVEAYSRLLPSAHQLVATFFVELEDVRTVREELARLKGVHHAIALRVGESVVPGIEIPGPDEEGPSEETVSVHFLRFPLDDAQRDAFRDPAVPAALLVDHPEYADEMPLVDETRRSLIADLAL